MNPVERRAFEKECEGLLQQAVERAELDRIPSIVSVDAGIDALVPVLDKMARVTLGSVHTSAGGAELALRAKALVWTGERWTSFLMADCPPQKMAAVLDHIMAALKYWAELK